MAYCTAFDCRNAHEELTAENGVLVERRLPNRREGKLVIEEWDPRPVPFHVSCVIPGWHRILGSLPAPS